VKPSKGTLYVKKQNRAAERKQKKEKKANERRILRILDAMK